MPGNTVVTAVTWAIRENGSIILHTAGGLTTSWVWTKGLAQTSDCGRGDGQAATSQNRGVGPLVHQPSFKGYRLQVAGI